PGGWAAVNDAASRIPLVSSAPAKIRMGRLLRVESASDSWVVRSTARRRPPFEGTLVGGAAEDDQEVGGPFANLRLRDRLEVHHQQLPVDGVAAAGDAVPLVARVAVDEKLGGEQLPAALLDLDVDVRRRPARVRHRLDGAEVVRPVGPGGEPAEPLE